MSERAVHPLMRAILWVGGIFVLIAGTQLFLFPGRTDEFFAWTIASELSAATLGAFYFSAAVLALGSARQETWARARLGIPGILAFVWLTLIATLIHLDLFHLDSNGFLAQVAAWAWLAVYVIEPPVLTWAFVAQLRAPGGDPERLDPLPGAYRVVLYGLACALLLFGAALFVAPLDVADLWPWPLTELVAQAIAAWIVALGGFFAAFAWENERSRIRLGVLLPLCFVALQAIAFARFGDEVDWGSPESLAFVAALAAIGGAAAWGLGLTRRTGPA